MSVWQEYLLGLAYVYPTDDIQIEITDRVFGLLKILLHHAIKYEFGGWRVWIDTLSILHGRVTDVVYLWRYSSSVSFPTRYPKKIIIVRSIRWWRP